MKKKVAFFGLCLGFFVVMMDTTTVPLIYTTIIRKYEVSPGSAAWINNAYLIIYAGFLLLGGRVGDAFNRRVVLSSALVILAIGALISGLGQTLLHVIAGRAIMGIGAGLLAPQSMAFISILFAKGGRGAALGIWGAVAGIATATGPVITQAILQVADWRWVMWINIPIALLALLLAFSCLPTVTGNGAKTIELVISGLSGLALIAIVLGLEFLSNGGAAALVGSIFFLLGILVMVLIIRYDLKYDTHYLLSPDLWRDRPFLRACLISGLLGFSLTAFYLPLAFLFELRMLFGPVEISFAMITIALVNAIVGPFAGYFSDKIVPEIIVRVGMGCFALATLIIGSAGFVSFSVNSGFIIIIAGMLLAGIGTGLAFAPLANIAFGRASFTTVGRAAAFFNVIRQVMSALGSVIVALLFDHLVRFYRISTESLALNLTSSAVAFAAFCCFMLIAFCLSLGAWLSRSQKII
ncbi:MFS transporter [Bartonella queenslandensis]|uniref:MFS transporter n=1 Tax=Bartonella queenslandensis TaxID=481138 RepID=UPI001BA6221D|nr:MFS transporter [Bartonella queenslandensis]